MKRFFLILIFTLCYSALFAQHISFLGIQLGQSLKVIDRFLLQKGFKNLTRNYEILPGMYRGTFWIYQNATIEAEIENNVVTSIRVMPAYGTVERMSDFEYLASNLDKKYGKHVLTKDVFRNSNLFYFSEYSGGYCWKVNGGYIVAQYGINKLDKDLVAFNIYYLDRTNKHVLFENGSRRNTNNDL